MVKQIFRRIPLAIMVALPVLLSGCNGSGTGAVGETGVPGESDTGTNGGTGTLEVLLHDAPANYKEVNVFIESVEVNNTEDDTGWVAINSPQQTYNLLELTNGATAVLGSKELPAGTYQQIRLILSGDGHSVVVDGRQHDLSVPGGKQTGIKLKVNAEIQEDITYTLLLDFDASRSVVERGNEQSGKKYLLKPVIRAANEAVTGSIAGVVEPADSKPFVYAIAHSDTLSSTKADTTDGSFRLIGLEEGTYTISVDPVDTYQPSDTTGVEVTTGETSDIGTVKLSLSQN